MKADSLLRAKLQGDLIIGNVFGYKLANSAISFDYKFRKVSGIQGQVTFSFEALNVCS